MSHNLLLSLALAAVATAAAPHAAQAQTQPAPAAAPWTLEACIEHARANNLQVQSAQISAEAGEIELEAAKAARYPTLSFSSGQNVSHQSAIKLINDYGEIVSDGSFSYGGSYGIGSTTSIYQAGACATPSASRSVAPRAAALGSRRASTT